MSQEEDSNPTHVKTTNKVDVQEAESEVKNINQYTIKKKIGEGAFGTVFLVTDVYGKEFALKEVNKRRIQKKGGTFSGGKPGPRGGGGLRVPPNAGKPSPAPVEDAWDMIKREIAIMKKLTHKHVILLKEVLDDDSVDCLYMGELPSPPLPAFFSLSSFRLFRPVVMENASNGTTMDLNLNGDVPPLPMETARKYFREMVLGVEYCKCRLSYPPPPQYLAPCFSLLLFPQCTIRTLPTAT